MNFEKPKVFIDLEEYQQLKDKVNEMNTDEYVLACKKVIAAIFNNMFDWKKTSEQLMAQNISLFMTHNSRSNYNGDITPDDISISIIKKIKQHANY